MLNIQVTVTANALEPADNVLMILLHDTEYRGVVVHPLRIMKYPSIRHEKCQRLMIVYFTDSTID